MKIQILQEKTIISSENKKLAFLLFVLASTTNVREETLKTHKVSWQVLCKLYDHIIGPKKLRTKCFKTKAIVPKKDFGIFFSNYPPSET